MRFVFPSRSQTEIENGKKLKVEPLESQRRLSRQGADRAPSLSLTSQSCLEAPFQPCHKDASQSCANARFPPRRNEVSRSDVRSRSKARRDGVSPSYVGPRFRPRRNEVSRSDVGSRSKARRDRVSPSYVGSRFRADRNEASRSDVRARFQPCRKSHRSVAASAAEGLLSQSDQGFNGKPINDATVVVLPCQQDVASASSSSPVGAAQLSPARKRWVGPNWIPSAVGAAQAASVAICAIFLLFAPCTHAKIYDKSKTTQDPLDAYLATARKGAAQPAPTVGSLWDPNGRMGDMATDAKARYVGDLVTINIAESTSSAQQESAQTSRAFSASSSLAALLGTTGAREQNLFSPSSNQSLNGKGQTALSTSLTTTLAASVTEALPNGMLVIEARRDVEVTNQRETMVLRGVIRREDLSPLNAISSTAISHLEVSLKGNGVVSDGTRPPNVVVRVLLRVFGF